LKPFFPAVVALVAGIVLGAWQPRGELLAARAELDALRTDHGGPCRGGAADSIRSILHADAPSVAEAPSHPHEGRVPAAIAADEPVVDEPTPPADEQPVGADAPADQTPEQMKEAMHTALDARRAQALAALVEQGELSDDEVEAVNTAMDHMNQELASEVDGFVDDALRAGEVDRRDVMDFAADALDIVIAADDDMRKAVPPEVYDEIDDSAVDPFSYVSGDTLDALARLQGMPSPVFE
jgi:hypothetical protein